jgi:hypothetical protein
MPPPDADNWERLAAFMGRDPEHAYHEVRRLIDRSRSAHE